MRLGKIMGLAAALSLVGCANQKTEAAEEEARKAKESKDTEASYRVLFERDGCKFVNYVRYENGTGKEINAVICQNGSTKTSTTQIGDGVTTFDKTDVVTMDTAPAAKP